MPYNEIHAIHVVSLYASEFKVTSVHQAECGYPVEYVLGLLTYGLAGIFGHPG